MIEGDDTSSSAQVWAKSTGPIQDAIFCAELTIIDSEHGEGFSVASFQTRRTKDGLTGNQGVAGSRTLGVHNDMPTPDLVFKCNKRAIDISTLRY